MILSDEDVSTHEVRDWKGLHLLHFQSSSCSQKVRVLLREKGLAWTSHSVDLAAHKHVSPWYLGINPRGVVPVLVHDGVVHVESNDILQYLDELPSDAAPFFPQTDAEHAAVRANLDLENSLHMDLRNLTMGFIMPHRFAKKSAATLDRWEREGRSNPKRAIEVAWWRDYARDGIPALVARASVDAHRAVFESLEQKLAESEWLLGDRISVLEIAWFITTTRLSSAGYPISDHPRLTKWHQRLASLPAFAEETRDPFLLRAVLPLYQLFRRITKTQLTDITRRA